MKRLAKFALAGLAILFLPIAAFSQTNPVVYDAAYFIQVDAGAEKFCSLVTPYNQAIPVPEKIQATASLTVTAVSGNPFTFVEAGDQLLVVNSDGVSHRLTVATRASATSITVAGLDSTGALYTALTLTNASFKYRENVCGTGINDGVIDVSQIGYKVITPYISANTQDGNFQLRIQCRTGPGVPWSQMVPTLTPPAVTATYNSYATGVLGIFSGVTPDGFTQCRVGVSFSTTDSGAPDYVSVSLSGIR